MLHRHQTTFSRSDKRIARYVAQPVARFLSVEASGGVLLLVATLVALAWANAPWSASYEQLWTTTLSIEAGPMHLAEDLRHWVNDGLMAVFFFVVGLEIKQEFVSGHLSDRRDAILPVVAAAGGMVVPAALYLLLNVGGDHSGGWGVPVATDIAFAVGLVTLLGRRIPQSLKVLLLGVAVADDIGAIAIIAIAYTDTLDVRWLVAALATLGLIAGMRRARVWYLPVYLFAGVAAWGFTLESGVHATIAGVAMGFLTPVKPLIAEPDLHQVARRLSEDVEVSVDEVRELEFELRESVSVGERFADALHPWTSRLVIPLFALANAGIPVSLESVGDAATSRVALGIIVGLVVGKPLGIALGAWIAVRSGRARLPQGVSWELIVGMGAVAGIGFTVSIFVTGLAFDPDVQDVAKLGVLAASAVAAALGTALLWRGSTEKNPVEEV